MERAQRLATRRRLLGAARRLERGSAVMEQKALSVGFTRSIRSRTARQISTGESVFLRISASSTVAGV